MNRKRSFLIFASALLALVVLSWGVGQDWAQSQENYQELNFKNKIKPAERKAAAKRAQALGLKPGIAGKAAAMPAGQQGASALDVPIPLPSAPDGPGGTPHYFGPYGNWAYSPLPKGPITAVTIVDGGFGYSAGTTAVIEDVYGTGAGAAAVTVTVDALGTITGLSGGLGGTNYSAPIVTITDPAGTGTGAAATASIATVPLGTNYPAGIGIRKFVDKVPGLTPTGANALVTPNRLGAGPATTGGQYIPVAVSDTAAYPGPPASDYYVIGLVEFYEKMHSDLPPTRHRGYVQLSTAAVPGAQVPLTYLDGAPILYPGTATQVTAVDYPHYLGPTIVGTSNKPVRIKFYNLLPRGAENPLTGSRPGDLFLPVDETVMGSGMGPVGPGTAGETYTQNRAAVHLHGNNTVWISDGTPHQWITPAGEITSYPQGVSVRNVPDMDPASVDSPTDGAMTLYYTNAMSARLMFYHDHAMGITRLNVYAGNAAGYVLTDQVDQDMINGTNVSGVNPNLLKVLPDIGIPLVIQDRTFVDETTIWAQDPTWNWGTGPRVAGKITAAVRGDLWYPHVYMSAQNPWDLTGTNAFGRWHYGPWFNPPTPTCVNGLPVGCVEVGPVPNPYYQADCDLVPPGPGCTAPWEPPLMPGNPNPSMPGEAFMDTPIVNGTAYPYLEVEPRAYRFRILNAGNDRFVNLQLYVAADKTTPTTAGTNYTLTPARLCDGASGALVADCTEVKMVPISVAPANQYADWPSGIPDPATKGPAWVQIGTEGGFLPKPVVIPQQPIGWNLNPTLFNFGTVNQHSLLLGTAERADVVVDFGAYAGKTLILYNDAPAAFPAGVPSYDYYTGVADQMDVGGAPSTQPGYGPNTRTVMQIRVAATATTPTPQVTLANLNAVFAKGPAVVPPAVQKRGVFEVSQDPIIIPQAAYNSAYNSTFSATAAGQYIQINDTAKTFQPINAAGVLQPAVTMPLEMKAMHDEMGGVYDTQFGRMSGMLGLSLLNSPNHVLVPYPYAGPPVEIHMGSVAGSQIGSFPDGTQIWRIFHNGVDTHPIHVHLFNAQLINRLGQDGVLLPPDANELGWKDTFRVNPLEIIYLAMRPVIPTAAQVPFDVPNSIRLIDPTLPEGAVLITPPPAGWFDPNGVNIAEILNHYVNFGWEYVWHCHILAHEEMDMMHSLVFAIAPKAPTSLSFTRNTATSITLAWLDNSLNETGFRLQRATDVNFTTGLTTLTFAPNTTTYTDSSMLNNQTYWYRVLATNLVGDTQVYANSSGFPVRSADSTFSNVLQVTNGTVPAGPAAPTNLTATLQAGPQVSLTWRDNATNETGFVVERCTGAGCANFVQIATTGPRNFTGNMTYVDTTVAIGNTYIYRVKAINAGGSSAYSNQVTVVVAANVAAPTNFRVSIVDIAGPLYRADLTWAIAANPTSFTIQRAKNAAFSQELTSSTVAGNLRSLSQNLNANTTRYYRIRANGATGSSAWVNVIPFPVRTGP